MTTHFIDAEVDLNDSAAELQKAVAAALAKRGRPLRWAITAVDTEQQTAKVEAVVTRAD